MNSLNHLGFDGKIVITGNRAEATGFDRRILHRLCTPGVATRIVTQRVGAHPAESAGRSVRRAAAGLSSDVLMVVAGEGAGLASFEARVRQNTVLGDAKAWFA